MTEVLPGVEHLEDMWESGVRQGLCLALPTSAFPGSEMSLGKVGHGKGH